MTASKYFTLTSLVFKLQTVLPNRIFLTIDENPNVVLNCSWLFDDCLDIGDAHVFQLQADCIRDLYLFQGANLNPV